MNIDEDEEDVPRGLGCHSRMLCASQYMQVTVIIRPWSAVAKCAFCHLELATTRMHMNSRCMSSMQVGSGASELHAYNNAVFFIQRSSSTAHAVMAVSSKGDIVSTSSM